MIYFCTNWSIKDFLKWYLIDWFKNYLSNRNQYVSFNSSDQIQTDFVFGVPQGSILGPLLFILYPGDITNTLHVLDLILFADDTWLIFVLFCFFVLFGLVLYCIVFLV